MVLDISSLLSVVLGYLLRWEGDQVQGHTGPKVKNQGRLSPTYWNRPI